MTDPEITGDDELEAFRTAVAMARAAHQGDAAGVGVLFNNAEHRNGVLYELSRLPAQLAQGVAGRFGHEVDVDQALAGLLQSLPQSITDESEEDR